jgi:L-Ala-D/L-Glu epimerase
VKVRIRVIGARLRAPFGSAWGAVLDRDLVLLELEDADGDRGIGEAAPLAGYDGFAVDDARRDLERCRPVLEASDGGARGDLVCRCAELTGVPHALAAIDMALWDLTARRAGEPVWRSIGASQGPPVDVNWTISASDRAGASREADTARSAGYRCVKVKVGIGDDAGRLAAVRAAGGADMAIRIDANGAWTVVEAAAALRALEPVGLELCEEPVHGLGPIAQLSGLTGVDLAIDETGALEGALDRRACAAVCLKVGRSGGISGLIAAAHRARAAGYEVYLASALDGPAGIAAALHAAAVVRPERFCGLATLPMFAEETELLTATAGAIEVPSGPGLLGEAMEWYGAG